MKFIIGSFLAVLSVTGFSQTMQCGTDYFYAKEYQKDPSFQNEVEQNWIMSDGPLQESAERGARAVQIIPVVFHVFHSNGIGNISYDQILSAMDMINADFRRTNSDTGNTRALFKPFAADAEVEFRLAQIDPNGNCTNGVVRVNNSDVTYNADNTVKSYSAWPSSKYFNIWVVNTIESSGVSGIILGYAQFPGSGSWSTYGVVIRNDRVGTIGTATSRDRTLTHEIGHCLNLLHTFQSGCGSSCDNSGDRVCDTPPVKISTQGCNRGQNQCSNDVSGNSVYTSDVVDQIENYMSYDDCQNMFSLGQNVRMQNALTNFATLTNLVSSANLTATGVLNTNPGICEAEFESNTQVICVGQSITFTDVSFFNPKQFQWNFAGGFPIASTSKSVTVTYDKPGTYEVNLTVTDTFNTSVTTTKTNYVTVLSSLGHTAPLQESFEGGFALADVDWIGDDFPNNFGWKLGVSGGATGSNALKANAYGKTGKIKCASPAYDASNLDSATVSFKYAYAPITTGEPSNFIKVLVSADCGNSWYVQKVIGGAALRTVPALNSEYRNPLSADFERATFIIPSQLLTGNLRIMFEFNTEGGNNLFIDDIQMYGETGNRVILVSPLNNATDLSVKQTLNWNASSQVDYYTVEMDTDTNFNSSNYVTQQINYATSASNNRDTEFKTDSLMDGETYYWRVKSTLNGVDTAFSETWKFTVNASVLGIPMQEAAVSVSVFPNPANEVTYIQIKSASNTWVEVGLFDALGKQIRTLHSGSLSSGEGVLTLHRNGLNSGLYFIQVTTESGRFIKKLILQ